MASHAVNDANHANIHPNGITILVRLSDGVKNVEIAIDVGITVADVRSKVAAVLQVKAADVTLALEGRPLTDFAQSIRDAYGATPLTVVLEARTDGERPSTSIGSVARTLTGAGIPGGAASTSSSTASDRKEEPASTASAPANVAVFSYVNLSAVSAKLVCSICHDPATEPRVHAACNNLYCEKCINDWLETHTTCPACRKKSALDDFHTNAFIQGLLNEIPVLCPNNKAGGCEWRGERGSLSEHLQRFCLKVPCGQRACDWLGTLSRRDEHVATECAFVIVPCPEGCGVRMERGTLKTHVASACTAVHHRSAEELRRARELKETCDELNPPFSDFVTLDINGTVVRTTRAALTKYPASVLGVMFSERHRAVEKNSEGVVFLNALAKPFGVILAWLHTGILPTKESDYDTALLRHEAGRWGLDALLKELDAAQQVQKLRPAAVAAVAAPMPLQTLQQYMQIAGCASGGRLSLPGTDLSGLYLGGARLERSILTGTRLVGTNLGAANLAGSDLRSADLTNADLQQANLAGCLLSKSNLKTAVLVGANLSGVDLSGWDLSGYNLSNVNLTNANLSRAVLAGTNLTGAVLVGVNLTGVDLTGRDFAQHDLSNVNFTDANLTNVKLVRATLVGATLKGADLTGRDLTGCNLTQCNFTNSKLVKATLAATIMVGVNLSGVDLTGRDFAQQELTKANFTGATLKDASFSSANVTSANFKDAVMPATNLSGANLTNAGFSGANLTGSNLENANLTGTILTGADLTGANLKKCNVNMFVSYSSGGSPSYDPKHSSTTKFAGANLTNADLSGQRLLGFLLTGTILHGANLSGCTFGTLAYGICTKFDEAQLCGANLSNIQMQDCNLTGLDLSNANLSKAQLKEVNFSKAILAGATFCGATLTGVQFNEANVVGANFSSTQMERVHFDAANAVGANFSDAVLRSTSFAKAKLSGNDTTAVSPAAGNLINTQANVIVATFTKAVLTINNRPGTDDYWSGTNFANANLSYVDFSGQILSGCNLSGANIRKANFTGVGFTGANLAGCQAQGAHFTDAKWSKTLVCTCYNRNSSDTYSCPYGSLNGAVDLFKCTRPVAPAPR